MPTKLKQKSIWLSPEKINELKAEAQRLDISVNALIKMKLFQEKYGRENEHK